MIALISTLMFLVVVVTTAWISRRVLGVPVGWPRLIVIVIMVQSTAAAAVTYLLRLAGLSATPDQEGLQANPGLYFALTVLAALWTFLGGLVALVLLELFLPTGTLPTLRSLVTGWRARRRRVRRYAQISAIAVRHGLGGYLRGRRRTAPSQSLSQTARSLSAALNDAGVAFIKFGQMLSSRPDLVPEVFTRELSSLQSQADPEPWSRIEAALTTALGRPPGEVFARIDRDPLAAASVAQVHRAALRDGTEVVLKVQRPGARQQVAADTDILLRMARWLERSTAWGAALGVQGLAQGFAASLEEELDYTVELDNMRALGADRPSAQQQIRVPAAYPELSSQTLLVMEYVAGRPVGEAESRLAAMADEQRRALGEALVREVLEEIAVRGVFHADLHMGNVLLTDEDSLALLDLGSVGRLDAASRMSIGTLLAAVDRGDSGAATDGLVELLDRPDELDERQLERAVGQLMLRYGSGLGGRGSAQLFAELFPVILHHGFTVPPQVAAAFRALGALEGTAAAISPDLDLVQVAREQGERIIGSALTPQNVKEALESRLAAMLPTLQRLPRRVDRLAEQLEQGRFTVTVRPFADRQTRGFLRDLVQQGVVALLSAVAVLSGTLLITADSGPMLARNIPLYAYFGYCLVFVGFVLALRALVLVFRAEHSPDGR